MLNASHRPSTARLASRSLTRSIFSDHTSSVSTIEPSSARRLRLRLLGYRPLSAAQNASTSVIHTP